MEGRENIASLSPLTLLRLQSDLDHLHWRHHSYGLGRTCSESSCSVSSFQIRYIHTTAAPLGPRACWPVHEDSPRKVPFDVILPSGPVNHPLYAAQ
jgi:hypothetical protein